MPIEVRELVIKARIEDISGGEKEGEKSSAASSSSISEMELQAIVEMCTEEVLKIIERKKQR